MNGYRGLPASCAGTAADMPSRRMSSPFFGEHPYRFAAQFKFSRARGSHTERPRLLVDRLRSRRKEVVRISVFQTNGEARARALKLSRSRTQFGGLPSATPWTDVIAVDVGRFHQLSAVWCTNEGTALRAGCTVPTPRDRRRRQHLVATLIRTTLVDFCARPPLDRSGGRLRSGRPLRGPTRMSNGGTCRRQNSRWRPPSPFVTDWMFIQTLTVGSTTTPGARRRGGLVRRGAGARGLHRDGVSTGFLCARDRLAGRMLDGDTANAGNIR